VICLTRVYQSPPTTSNAAHSTRSRGCAARQVFALLHAPDATVFRPIARHFALQPSWLPRVSHVRSIAARRKNSVSSAGDDSAPTAAASIRPSTRWCKGRMESENACVDADSEETDDPTEETNATNHHAFSPHFQAWSEGQARLSANRNAAWKGAADSVQNLGWALP
jgi:hypothetical protein